jgi:hypothetical protein
LGQLLGLADQGSGGDPLATDLEPTRAAVGNEVQAVYGLALPSAAGQFLGDLAQGVAALTEGHQLLQGSGNQLSDSGT